MGEREPDEPSPYADPPLMCDIVMKGGITSGVVYPGAILALARRYRFRSIGGTSAGAIAAAVLSAAEHARRGCRYDGFGVIEELPAQLGGTVAGGGRPFMLQLFQADRPTHALFTAALRFMGPHGRLLGPLGLLLAFWRSAVVAGVVFASSILLSSLGGADWAWGVGGIAASLVVFVVGAVVEALRGLRAITGNDFGLCRLGPAVGSAQKPALTGWLHGRIQAAAGRTESDPPLTFADLWGVRAASGPPSADVARLRQLQQLSHDAQARLVDLQMITTDLTQGRPVRLPVLLDRHELVLEDRADELLFDRLELRRFFPGGVVDHLVACAQPVAPSLRALESELFDGAQLEHAVRGADWERELRAPRLMRLAIGPDLPVVVATRMSLSFPILISGVPLWRLVTAQNAPPTIQRVIFSDGGITSNFPIHFFDSPLPRWPTFGLNLTTPAPGEAINPDDARSCVDAPPAPGADVPDRMRAITDLRSFASALVNAVQNWRDNTQARLPGFRDRIAHVKLADKEGGLNLTMDGKVIRRLNERGIVAGTDLRELFSSDGGDAPVPHWEDHRFARYRVTMAVMQRLLRNYRTGYTTRAPDDDVTTPYAQRIVEGETAPPFEFATRQRRVLAETTSRAYASLGAEPDDPDDPLLDDRNVPRPPATMRTVPPV